MERDPKAIPMFSFRSIYHYQKLTAAFVGIFNLSDMNLTKNDLSLSYKHNYSEFVF